MRTHTLFSLKSLWYVLFLPAYEVSVRVINPNRLPAFTSWVATFSTCHHLFKFSLVNFTECARWRRFFKQ
jgi:hypothetical protein